MNLGKSIKKARKIKGISQGEMAKKLSVTQTHLSLIEQDKSKTSVYTYYFARFQRYFLTNFYFSLFQNAPFLTKVRNLVRN